MSTGMLSLRDGEYYESQLIENSAMSRMPRTTLYPFYLRYRLISRA
jgi:hypothetical protein